MTKFIKSYLTSIALALVIIVTLLPILNATTSLPKQAYAISFDEIKAAIRLDHDLYDLLKAVIPDEGKTADSKGLDLVKLGQYNQSIGYFDKALEIDPNDVLALTAKGQSLSFLVYKK